MCTCYRVSTKCIKMKKARAKRAELLLFTIKYACKFRKFKGLAKLGNIVAETMFLVMFPGVAKLGNICFGRKICVWEAIMNVFDSRQKHFLFSEQQNLFPQHRYTARLNWETFASAKCFLV